MLIHLLVGKAQEAGDLLPLGQVEFFVMGLVVGLYNDDFPLRALALIVVIHQYRHGCRRQEQPHKTEGLPLPPVRLAPVGIPGLQRQHIGE